MRNAQYKKIAISIESDLGLTFCYSEFVKKVNSWYNYNIGVIYLLLKDLIWGDYIMKSIIIKGWYYASD